LAAAGALFSSLLVSSGAFAVGAGARAGAPHRQVFVRAEDTASSSGSSVSIVKMTEENKMTTASVLGGVLGLLLGGVWVGAATFAASSYLSRREDDDFSKALKGVAAGGLEVLNFGGYVNEKYAVTGQIGSAIENALGDDAKKSLRNVVESVEAVDKDVGFKETFGSLCTNASELATKAVTKAVEVNEEYKISEQIVDKVKEATQSATK